MTSISNGCVRLEATDERVLTVWLNSTGRSVNVFDAEMIAGLEAAVEHVASQPQRYRAVVFRSEKRGNFFAGADVNAIASLTNEADLRAILGRGQKLMRLVAQLPVPTIAALNGACLGGGLEFALACRYRLASDSPRTVLGLPEIKLGLIPGWGGTQRLPKLIGVQRALELILKGNSLPAAKALRYGLVDALLPQDAWENELNAAVMRIAEGQALRVKRKLTWLDRFLNHTSLGRAIVFRLARKQIAGQKHNYPATVEVIAAVEQAMRYGTDGFAFERDAFTRLLFSRTARSLLGLFQQRDQAKRVATWVGSADDKLDESFTQVAVIGAGAMGAGIGTLAASKGYAVVFKEINDAAVEAGRSRVAELLAGAVSRHRLSASERESLQEQIEFTTDWDQLADCDLAIEAVLEIDQVKRDVFLKLDQRLPRHAALTSNTSSLSVTRMATATSRLGQVAGLHFFNPVDRMELVEVVRTEASDEQTIKRLLEFVKSLGKTPIVTSDKPGFLVNRVLFPYLGEAVRMVSEGYSIQSIDRELRSFGMPMGPLELLDQVGIDIASHVAQSLAVVQPDAGVPAGLLSEMASTGWLGKKSKLGFYDYRGKRSRPNGHFTSLPRSLPGTYSFIDDQMTPTQRRLVYAMLNEAVHCLDEQVVSEPWMVDLGMVLGTGFAPMHGGPLRLIDSLGLLTVQHNMLGLAQLHGPRFAPADGINRLTRSRGQFLKQPAVTLPQPAPSIV
jgi:3-hydroxyacyl-CoA dehydrogenase/enoyl-CoA hydratase/carnithine racemase